MFTVINWSTTESIKYPRLPSSGFPFDTTNDVLFSFEILVNVLNHHGINALWHERVKNHEIHERLNLKGSLFQRNSRKLWSLHQNSKGKTLDKITQTKTDHKSKLSDFLIQLFQVYKRAVSISCHEQKAQMQGWPDLTPALVGHGNQSEKLDGRSRKIEVNVPLSVDEWSVISLA
mgnify:FL=1